MKKLIEIMLEKKVFTCLLLFAVTLAGVIAYQNLKIDVFPDPSPVLVQVLTEAEGMAPEEVEKFVSYPVEISLYGLPHVQKITSLSTFGLSTVNVLFADQVDIHFARQLVSQQLPPIREKLPSFVEAPALGPITTGLGMVYIYALKGTENIPLIELRTQQDWVIKFQLQTVPGIAAVMSHGGDIKQFQVLVNPDRLLKYNLHLHEVIENIKKSSKNITAGYITRNREEYVVRGIGLLEGSEALKRVLVKDAEAAPVYLEDIAEIKIGSAVKRGEALLNKSGRAVSGIVMKLIGVNTSALIEKIDKRIEEINAGLPEDIRLVPVYNQALMIKAAFRTVAEALVIGIILVAVILFLFVNDLSSALVSTLSIPFAVFTAFIAMGLTDMTADLMSFGGLAVGIGLLVDATIVVVENISRNRHLPVLSALNQVLRPLVYAMAMIILSFLPILTLPGLEGKLFRPFGFTLLVAVVSAIVYAVFFSPVLMKALGSRQPGLRKADSPGLIFSSLKRFYLKAFDFFYKREALTILVFLLVFMLCIAALLDTGSEFIPTLKEQALQLEVTLPQNTALEETVKVMDRVHKEVLEFSEIQDIYSRVGRGEAGSHPHPVNVGNSLITLKPRKHWQVDSEEELIGKIQQKLKKKIPGIILNFTQPIKHNLDYLITGVRADLAIKVYGDDYRQLMGLAEKIGIILSRIQGIEDIQVSRVAGLNEIAIRLKREALARYGLNPEDVLEEVEASMGGRVVTRIYQGDVVSDVLLRYAPEYRNSIRNLSNLFISSDKGHLLPLSAVADIQDRSGFANISRENGKRYITVQGNVRGRDIGSVVAESRQKIYGSRGIALPFGYYLSWGGQFELKERAEKRLYLVLFITFSLILVLLFDFLKSWKDILAILVNLPVSLSGGILSLWLAGAYLSVPSTIGFIALLGIALENSLILISFFKRMTAQNSDFDAAIRESVALRLRPVLMTKFTTIIGLFPLLFSKGIGSEIQRPLVIVVIGGIFFSIFTTLLLMPVIYRRLYRK